MIVEAPFSPDQVLSLNDYQMSGAFHEFTCGNSSTHPLLLATESGWVCLDCGYMQNWAHLWMTDWTWLERIVSGFKNSPPVDELPPQ